MKRSGFTMIELIFVVFMLGILAVIAMVMLAGSRDDAKAVMIKKDIEAARSFVPSQAVSGDGVENFDTAIQLDETKWLVSIDRKKAIYYSDSDNVVDCVTMEIHGDKNEDQNLTILINETNTDRACVHLHENLAMDTNETIELKGRKLRH